MNGWVGSRHMERQRRAPAFRTFLRESELAAAKPSSLWVLLDEQELSIDDAWFLVTMDDQQPFASFPAFRHQGGYALNFADGHVELYRLADPASLRLGVYGATALASNSDWLKLKEVTTRH